jgi:hypothetical protein
VGLVFVAAERGEAMKGWLAWLRAHPLVTGLWAAGLILGPGVGWWVLQPAYGTPKALLAGAIGGAGAALILSANRLID